MPPDPQISVVIPTLNAKAGLARTLASLEAARDQGLVAEVIIADGGSTDATRKIAGCSDVRIVDCAKGRGVQLAAGAKAAMHEFLLFVHADTELGPGWVDAVSSFLSAHRDCAAVFRLKFSAKGLAPRIVAFGANIRTRIFSTPYGDQGLLLSKTLYEEVGGFRAMTLFEDVDFIDRLIKLRGRAALKLLDVDAITSAERYEHDGYVARVLKNFRCLMMYRRGADIDKIEHFYR